MKHREATQTYGTMLNIWPAAKQWHDGGTKQEWLGFLEELNERLARHAVNALRTEEERFPSFAAFKRCYDDTAASQELAKPAPKALGGPVDVSGRAKIGQTLQWLKQPRAPITAAMLDEAGVARWRERLRDASLQDEEESRPGQALVHIDHMTGERSIHEVEGKAHGKHYDMAWALIRAEAGFVPLVLPDGTMYGDV